MIGFIKRAIRKILRICQGLKNNSALRRGRKEIVKHKNSYCGKRCFIIGNGPSLKVDDLEKLKNEITFGSHGIYYIFKDTDWRPTFYCAQDAKLIKERYREIKSECKKIECCFGLVKNFAYPMFSKKNVCIELDINQFENGFPKFSDDLSKCAYEGFTVTYFNIQLAAYMGFSEIYLLGVDHNYSISMNPDGTVNVDKSVGDHFCKKDTLANIPQTYKSTAAYYMARKYADEHGIKIFNATRGGKLDAFERVDFDDLFNI